MGTIVPRAILSVDAPAYASAGTADYASDLDRDLSSHHWAASSTAWLAFDLSAVPSAQRQSLLVMWVSPWVVIGDQEFVAGQDAGLPGPYVYEGSANSTNGSDGDWTTLHTRADPEDLRCRSVTLSFTGYTWLRFRGTGNNNTWSTTPGTTRLKLYVWDASAGDDSILFLGDSISVGLWSGANFSMRVREVFPDRFPHAPAIAHVGSGTYNALESVPGQAYNWIAKWLATFPGKYVANQWFANDPYASYADQQRALADQIIAAGKTPILLGGTWLANKAGQETQLSELGLMRSEWVDGAPPTGTVASDYAGQILVGPDLWGEFYGRNDLLNPDGVHVSEGDTPTGYQGGQGVARQLIAEWWCKQYVPLSGSLGTPSRSDHLVPHFSLTESDSQIVLTSPIPGAAIYWATSSPPPRHRFRRYREPIIVASGSTIYARLWAKGKRYPIASVTFTAS